MGTTMVRDLPVLDSSTAGLCPHRVVDRPIDPATIAIVPCHQALPAGSRVLETG
jgi:hypothetical protein